MFETASALVCVEVKTARVRSLDRALPPAVRPGRRFDRRRYRRQAAAARLLAAARPGRLRPRVDLVEVFVDRRTGRVRLLHHCDVRGGFPGDAGGGGTSAGGAGNRDDSTFGVHPDDPRGRD